MGLPCLFTRQRGVKMGYFYWLRVTNSNHLHSEISLGYLKDAKFYLESKASIIDISSIASFTVLLQYLVYLARSRSEPFLTEISALPSRPQVWASFDCLIVVFSENASSRENYFKADNEVF